MTERPGRRLRPLWSRLRRILRNRRQTTVIGTRLNHLGGTPVRGRCTGQPPLVTQTPRGVSLQLQTLQGASVFFCSCNPCGVLLFLLINCDFFFFCVCVLHIVALLCVFFEWLYSSSELREGALCALLFLTLLVQTSSAGALLLPFFARPFILAVFCPCSTSPPSLPNI